MKPIPGRSHSRSRVKYRPDGLSIFYRRANEDVEEEMIRFRVVRDGKTIDDSLRSSVSSPPETASWTTLPGEEGSTRRKKKRPIKIRHRMDKNKKNKPKSKSKFSLKKKRLTSRSVQPKKQWRLSRKEEIEDPIDTSSHYILDHLRFLNGKIREKYQIATMCGHVHADIPMWKSESFENITIMSDFSRSDSSRSPSPDDAPKTALTMASSSSPVLTAEAYDKDGVPITPRRNIAPFPDEDPAEKKERTVLLAVKDREERKRKEKEDKKSNKAPSAEFIKPPVPPATEITESTESKKEKPKEKEKSIKPTRVSSDTKFPGARSPATREKVRLLLKDCALKKRLKDERDLPADNAALAESLKNIVKERDERKKKEKEEKKKKKEEAEKKRKEDEENAKIASESSRSSLKTIYSTSVLACESCTACIGCVAYCVTKHPKVPLSENEKPPESGTSASDSSTSSTTDTDSSEDQSKNKSQFF